jgi:flagellin-like protein
LILLFILYKTGVSPVIAVILMVAITVVLAATVYVWVSGFGSGGGKTPNLSCSVDNANDKLIVTSADPALKWGDIMINGTKSYEEADIYRASGTTISVDTDDVMAGDYIKDAHGTYTFTYKPTNTALGEWTVY